MKKYYLAFFALLLFAGCEKESVTPATLEADTAVDFRSASKRLVLHNTGSSSNPWEVIEVSDMAYQKAHQGHGDKVVGDAHAGGIIFYLADTPTDLNGDGKPDLGLVAATADQGPAPWGCYGNISGISGADGTGVGTGRQNTDDILAGCNVISPIAASLARAYNGGGYTDWFLPSKDELNLMYENRESIGASGFYWSSTEYDFLFAWNQFFFNGYQTNFNKVSSERVRAVRAF